VRQQSLSEWAVVAAAVLAISRRRASPYTMVLRGTRSTRAKPFCTEEEARPTML